jgi:Bacterial alpha-L-rhamnosidase 6 hairpin glycosidase domain
MDRRAFNKLAGMTALGGAAMLSRRSLAATATGGEDEQLHFVSPSMELQLSAVAPELLSLTIDGLGKGRRGANIVDPNGTGNGYKASDASAGGVRRVEYRSASADNGSAAAWMIELRSSSIVLASQWVANVEPAPMVIRFNLPQVHSTVLGVFGKDKLLAAPALIHCPGQGSMRIRTNVSGIGLAYAAANRNPIATLSLPGATQEQPRMEYTLEVTALYPNVPGIEGDERFDAFRRNWLDALQLNPSYPALANNTASDTCAFCYYEFADIAALTPPLADGLTALDIVRQTLDRALAGGQAYGLPPKPWTEYHSPFSDTFPAMLIAAANCVRAGHNDAWLGANYDGIKGWADTMLATDTNGDGLIKYSISGDSGIWNSGAPKFRPSNWWDTIGFGHEDAYANALAYRALRNMAMMAEKVGRSDDEAHYLSAAKKLHEAYYRAFFDPATGVLAGWRSADGKLHDYYFLFVNGIAIHYGLVDKPQANAIMDKLLAKMREVGYDKFNMGLPGNLVSVALKDCVDDRGKGRFGCGVQPDNSDGFQRYENGGATGAFAFFTLAALYDLGRKEEADKILFAILGEYDRCGFEQRGANGMSNDWRQWNGTPWGYEGLLTDDYYALLAVPLRQAEKTWHHGFRHEAALT